LIDTDEESLIKKRLLNLPKIMRKKTLWAKDGETHIILSSVQLSLAAIPKF
jgi:hypothetical protein